MRLSGTTWDSWMNYNFIEEKFDMMGREAPLQLGFVWITPAQ
jgi:hypothetical protein